MTAGSGGEEVGKAGASPQDAKMTAQLKALANPTRRRLLAEFAKRRYARAADLATELGLPANVVSFHLRVLAGAGFLEPDVEHARDRRDRVWKATPQAVELDGDGLSSANQVRANALLTGLVADHSALVQQVATYVSALMDSEGSDPAGAPSEARDHAYLTQAYVWLTAAQMHQAFMDFQHAVGALDEGNDPDAPDVRPWRIHVVAADDEVSAD